jgi:hypothetical protein
MKTTKLLTKGLALISVFGVLILGACDGFAPTIKVPFNSESDFSLTGTSSGKSLAIGEELIIEFSQTGDEIRGIITEFASDADLDKIKDGYVKNVTLVLKDVPENQGIDLTEFVTSFRLTVSEYNSTSKTEQLVATTKEVKAREITFELGEVGIIDFVLSGNGITFKLYGEYDKTKVPQIGLPMNIEVAAELVVALLDTGTGI